MLDGTEETGSNDLFLLQNIYERNNGNFTRLRGIEGSNPLKKQENRS